ncbi:MAG: hypothetical protein ACOCWG_05390 [bacterium]
MQKIIIIGLTPQGLAMLRMLTRAGHEVIAFTNTKKTVGYYSRYGTKKIFSDIPDLKKQIHQITDKHSQKIKTIITSGELLALIIEEYPELYDLCDVESGPFELIKMLSHKDKMYDFAQSRGLNCARYKLLSEYKPGDLQFPVILKRNYEIPLFFKVKKIENEAEFLNFTSLIDIENRKHIIIQEYIDKEKILNLSIQAYLKNGKCLFSFICNQKRRLNSGITSFLEELDDTHVVRQLEKISGSFFNNTKYTGFAELEFIYTIKNEHFFFIEINTRTCGLQSTLNQKFKNMPELFADSCKQLNIVDTKKNITWVNFARDIKARIQNRDFKNLNQFFTAKKDIFDWHDLKPFIMQFFK